MSRQRVLLPRFFMSRMEVALGDDVAAKSDAVMDGWRVEVDPLQAGDTPKTIQQLLEVRE